MKLQAALLLALLASTLAYKGFDYTSEYDLIEDLKDQDGKIFVLFFYASTNLHPMGYESVHHHFVTDFQLKERTDNEHDDIKGWADVTNDVYYNEFDVVNIQHDSVLHELGVEKSEIFSWPVTVVVQNGEGFQVTGPNSKYFVNRIVENLRGNGPTVSPGEYNPETGAAVTDEPAQPQQPVQQPAPTPEPTQPDEQQPTLIEQPTPAEQPTEQPTEQPVETVEISDNLFDEQPVKPVEPTPETSSEPVSIEDTPAPEQQQPVAPQPTPVRTAPRPAPTPQRPARPTPNGATQVAPQGPAPQRPAPTGGAQQRPAAPIPRPSAPQVRPAPRPAPTAQPTEEGSVPVTVQPTAGPSARL